MSTLVLYPTVAALAGALLPSRRIDGVDLRPLYNLRADPGENRDVSAEHPDVVARLETVVAAARAELGDSLTGARGAGLREAGNARQPPAGRGEVSPR